MASQRKLVWIGIMAALGSTVVRAPMAWASEEDERTTEISGVGGVNEHGAGMGGLHFSTQRVNKNSIEIEALAGASPTGDAAALRASLKADLGHIKLVDKHWNHSDRESYVRLNLSGVTMDIQADVKDFHANIPTGPSSPPSSFGPSHFQLGAADLSTTVGGSAKLGKNSSVRGHATLGVRPEGGALMDSDTFGALDFVVAPHGGGQVDFDFGKNSLGAGGNVIFRHDFASKWMPTDTTQVLSHLGKAEPDMIAAEGNVQYSYRYKTGQALTLTAVARYDRMNAKPNPETNLTDYCPGDVLFFGGRLGFSFR